MASTPDHSQLRPADPLTFVFTDIEGSTKKWEAFPQAMRAALEQHDALLRRAIEQHGGHVFKTIGDAFCAVFPNAAEAVTAALQFQQELARQEWRQIGPLRVRVGIHAGPADERNDDYFGSTVNRVARIQSIGYGGQTLLSETAADLCRNTLPPGAQLKDLGSHRLKDLGRSEHLFQLCHSGLADEFPPLRTLRTFTNNLPLQMSSFIGRNQEMADLADLVDRHRLVTLVGAGGTGKTRLSLQVAAERLEEHADGVWFVDLAPVSDGALVPNTLADVLHVQEEGGRPLKETLVDHLRSKTLLVILDNCEQVVDACASLAQSLLQHCPSVRMLATSREALNVPGERVWRLPPLSLPPLEFSAGEKNMEAVMLESDAVRLFVERARSQRDGFVLHRENAASVSEICRRLDGIPLALELAAARVRVLSVEQIGARLDDMFRLLIGGTRAALPRQQTLRALIDWSYDLLSETERLLLDRLAVFSGGWSLEASETICAGDGIEAGDVLDLLTSLLDKSLVVCDDDGVTIRYRLLETMRHYAGERLRTRGAEPDMRTRHRDFYLAFAEETEPLLRGPDQALWLARLEIEHDNLRAALLWCAAEAGHGDQELWLRLCVALRWFWDRRGHYSEGRRWLGQALDRTEGMPLSSMRLRGLHAAGVLARNQGDYAIARTYYAASLEGGRQLNDLSSIANSLNGLGNIANEQGDYAETRALYTESLGLSRQIGDHRGIAVALNNLGNVTYNQGECGSARTLFGECLSLFRLIGDQNGVAVALGNLGLVANEQADYREAQALFEESLELKRQIGDQRGMAAALCNLGLVASNQGERVAARMLYAESHKLHRQIEDQRGIAIALCGLGNVAFDEDDADAARAFYAESLLLSQKIGHQDGIVNSLEGLARVASSKGDAMRSGRIWGATEALREKIGSPLNPSEWKRQEKQREQTRAVSGGDRLDAALAAGRSLTPEQAVAEALSA